MEISASTSAEENTLPEGLTPLGAPAASEKDGPAAEYRRRLEAGQWEICRLNKLHIRFGNIRLLLAIIAVAMAWCGFRLHWISPWWLAIPIAAFVVVAVYHARVLRTRKNAQRAVEVYQRGLARIEDRWMGGGQQGERFRSPNHMYAADLDLFGVGSLFELLSTARTRMGEDTLAAWLLSGSPVEEIKARQTAVAELRGNLDLREDLAVPGDEVAAGVHPEALLQWAEAPGEMGQRWLRWLAPTLALLAVGTAAVWWEWGLFLPFAVVLVIEGAIMYRMRKRLQAVFSGAEGALGDLDLLAAILARLEREEFRSTRLQAVQQAITSHAWKGSRAIARLRTLVDFIDSRDNLFVKILDVPLMYSVQVAMASERWRVRHGRAVRSWLQATGEMEALLSLAAYHYEHPDDPFSGVCGGCDMPPGRSVGTSFDSGDEVRSQ